MIFSSHADEAERLSVLKHVLSGCPACDAYLAEAGPELDALLAESCVRALPEPELAPLTPEERKAIFAAVANKAFLAKRVWWRRWFVIAAPAALAATAVLLLAIFLPPRVETHDKESASWSGIKGKVGQTTVSLAVIPGQFGPEGIPQVLGALKKPSLVEEGRVLLFRVANSCAGYAYLVASYAQGEPELLWSSSSIIPPGEWTVQYEGMALGFPTAGRSGQITFHLVLTPKPITPQGVQAVLASMKSKANEKDGCRGVGSWQVTIAKNRDMK